MKMTGRVSLGWCLLLAAVFVLSFAGTGNGADRTAEYWSAKECGHEESPVNNPQTPQVIREKIVLLIAANRAYRSVERIEGRIYRYCVAYTPVAPNYQVCEATVSSGGRLILHQKRKVCGKR